MNERVRTLLYGLHGLLTGLGVGLHIGYYATRNAGPDSLAPTNVMMAGWVCYIAAFGLLAARVLTTQRGEPHPLNP